MPAGDRIQVRITYKGEEIRPTLNLKPTAANLKHAARQREIIVKEIADGVFDMAKHFPGYRFRAKHQPETTSSDRTFEQWGEVYAALAARSLEYSTLAIYKRHLKAYWTSVWGALSPNRITHEMVLRRLSELSQDRLDEATGKVHRGLGSKSQNNIMIPLRGVFDLICKPPSRIADPTTGIDNLKVQKAPPDPFAPDEVEIVLEHIARLEGPEMADWFEFSFFAGLRTSEQIALRWINVDIRTDTIIIKEARVMATDKDTTKTFVERAVELNDRAAAVLKRQRSRTQLQEHGRVFATPGQPAKPWHDEQVQWRAWSRALRLSGVRYRAPKEARDTSVTMALQAGANPVWVAAQHGHSVPVMMRDYAKWIPSADRGRNRAVVNQALSEPIPQLNRSSGAVES